MNLSGGFWGTGSEDIAGITLKPDTWCSLSKKERFSLVTLACFTNEYIIRYQSCLAELILKYDAHEPIRLPTSFDKIEFMKEIYRQVKDQCILNGIGLKWNDWIGLTELERYALLKLCRPGCENKNFVPALKEFGLFNKWADLVTE